MLIYNLINPVIILIMGVLGLKIGRRIPQKIQQRMLEGIGFTTMFIGVSLALEGNSITIMILSIVLGAALGEWLDIDDTLTRWGKRVQRRFTLGEGSQFMEAFISTSLLYCVGSMAILGPLQLGLEGNADTLMVKSTLDGIGSIIFAGTLGPGVLLSALSVFIYQTPIYFLASQIAPFLQGTLISNMTGVGGVIILMMGINMLEIKKIPTANYIPAIFMPMLIHGIMSFLPI